MTKTFKQFFNPRDIKPDSTIVDTPPKIDPKTGMHPQHGQHATRYKILHPQSAESMPPTGDQDTDSAVKRQTDLKKKARKIKNLVGKN